MTLRREFQIQATLLAVFLILVLGIGVADYFFYRSEADAIKEQAQQQLTAIADLKVKQIADWRSERLGDAATLRDSFLIESAVERWLKTGMNEGDKTRLSDWLNLFLKNFDYRAAMLLDAGGHPLVATDPGVRIEEATRRQLSRGAGSLAPELSDLRAMADGEPVLELSIPLYSPRRQAILGFILLRIDPQRFLFPLIQSWPVPSESGETLLVERRDDKVLYLNDLRHQKDTALKLILPADQAALPAVAAVAGKTLVMEGMDYRGVHVLAATRPIPGTPWSMVAKVDMREMLAPLHERFGIVAFISVLLLLTGAAMTLYLWRLQQDAFTRQQAREREAGLALKRTQERLLEAQRVGRIGSWERSLDSDELWWSEEAYRLFGYAPGAVRPTFQRFLDHVHPDDRQRVCDVIKKGVRSGEPYEVDYRVVMPDGETRHYFNYGRADLDDAGQPIRASGITQDVTDRVRIEEHLRRQSTQLQAVMENMPEGISVFDENLRLQLWNAGFVEVLNLPPEIVARDMSFDDLIRVPAERGEYGPGDVEEQIRARRELAMQFAPHRFERTRPNGRTHLTQGKPFFLDGKLAGFITSYTDITDRKRAEEELQQQHALLQTIVETLPSGISLLDKDLNCVVCNEEFKRLLDFPDQLFADGPPSLAKIARFNAERGEYGPGDPQAIAAAVVERARHPEAHFFERTRPNGVTIEICGRPLPAGGFVTTYTDITERKRAQENLLLAEKVFDNSPEAIMITDRQNRIVSVNNAFTLITGFAQDEVLDQDPRVLASGKHDADFYRQMWLSLKQAGHWAGEIWDRRKSGELYPKWMTINAVADKESREITHYVALFSDITERKHSEERIHFLAHHDALTGLPNRFALEARLSQACIEAQRNHRIVSVLFIDLDRFKVINDTLGHHLGDLLLIEVARRFTEAVRKSDTVARLGGDEFVIVLSDNSTPNAAVQVAGKIIESLAQPILIGTHELHTSPSIGIGIYPGDGEDVDTLMKNADTAMYHAKSLGRNNFQFYAEEMNRVASERLALESKLRQALRRNEFELHFQPQLAADGSRPTGVEALLRWNCGEDGWIPPIRFIPLAEETGLIVGIGEWVLHTACHQIKAWLDAGLPEVRVAVNVSARQLRQQDFPATVAAALAASGLPPQLLELEITESAIMERPEEARQTLLKLKETGITLAIDDFGTGYSSLAYLKLFPLDYLKIDRSFVTDIETDPNDAAICVSTIALAHSLGLHVIAEGVETPAQLALLRANGCDEVQGYFFSRPLAAEAAYRFLRQSAEDCAPPAGKVE